MSRISHDAMATFTIEQFLFGKSSMKKLKPFLPSAVAILAACLVSIVLIERVTVILTCAAIVWVTVAVAGVRWALTRTSRWRAIGATIAPAILFVAIAGSHLPLRLAFRLYRSQFEQAALQIEAANPPATPFRIGPFKIRMAGRRGDSGTPYLASNDETYEINGFVRHPDGYGFNLWSCITLDDAWSYIAED